MRRAFRGKWIQIRCIQCGLIRFKYSVFYTSVFCTRHLIVDIVATIGKKVRIWAPLCGTHMLLVLWCFDFHTCGIRLCMCKQLTRSSLGGCLACDITHVQLHILTYKILALSLPVFQCCTLPLSACDMTSLVPDPSSSVAKNTTRKLKKTRK